MKRTIVCALVVISAPAGAAAAGGPVDPGIEVVPVAGGCFTMGDAAGNGEFSSKPAHEVCVDDFAIGKYEVTREQYAKVTKESPPDLEGCPNCPADALTWEQAQAFVTKLGRLTGKKYRLPTEAEWEYACRAGGKDQKYCGGDDREKVAWDLSGGGPSHPVGQKKPNQLGLYDMSGNADEWVNDWYSEVFYWVSPKDNPVGPSSSWSVLEDAEPNRVLRGRNRAFDRGWASPKAIGEHTGLRVALSVRPASGPRPRPIPGKPGKAEGVDVLPRGGGAPGEAFTAWEKARADDMNKAFATMDKRSFVKKLLAMADVEAGRPIEDVALTDQQVEEFYESVRKEQPAKADTRIESGIAKGDLAILYSARARTDSGFSQTLVYMARKDGAWKVLKTLMRFHGESRH